MPLSTVDWPDQLVATVFTRGCPWDCPYCHNPHLLAATAPSAEAAAPETPTWTDVLDFLGTRVGLLDGVVFSGGEPCAQASIVEAAAQVRELGFSVGLHTAGSVPRVFEAVLPLAQWVGFDVKAPFGEYSRITRVHGSGERALESLRALIASGTAFEVRTTVHPELIGADDLARMADELEELGVRRWVVQPYRAEGVRPGLLGSLGPTDALLPERVEERFDFTVR